MLKDFFSETKNKIIVGVILVLLILIVIISVAAKKAADKTINVEGNEVAYAYNGEDQEIGVIGKDTGYPGTITLTATGDIMIEILNSDNLFYAVSKDETLYLTVLAYSDMDEKNTPYQRFQLGYGGWTNAAANGQGYKEQSYGVGDYNAATLSGNFVMNSGNDDSVIVPDHELPLVANFALINESANISYDFSVEVGEGGAISIISATVNQVERNTADIEGYDELISSYPQFYVPDAYVISYAYEKYLNEDAEDYIAGYNVHLRNGDEIFEAFVTSNDQEEAVVQYSKEDGKVTTNIEEDLIISVIESVDGNYSAVFSAKETTYLIKGFDSKDSILSVVNEWIKE